MTSFNEMGIASLLVKAIEEMGFVNPMPIQEMAIPEILHHEQDIVALAQTGTGKTAAFGLPVLQQIAPDIKKTQVLIMSPTRELCVQICNDLKSYAKYLPKINVVAIYGGSSIEKQKSELDQGAHIIVATPGRLLDCMRRKYVNFAQLRTVILDEADEILDMGFKEELDAILKEIPESKRMFLFSATMPKEVEEIARNYMRSAVDITAGSKNSGADNVAHQYFVVQPKNRYVALKRIADYYPSIYAIIFCKTRIETQEIATALIQDGYNADALHGDLSQAQRDHVMHRFRCKNLQMLVATDVAARGLDVNNLSHVINYNLPSEAEIYTHRSGRTGRANKTGISISIITPKEFEKIGRIERMIQKKFEHMKIPSGKDICEKQLFHIVDDMEKVCVNYTEIESFLPVIHKKLSWMDKEELIRRFVSVEFNRFLDYYRYSTDINAEIEPQKNRSERRKSEKSGTDKMSTLYFGIGYSDNIVPQKIIALINEKTGGRNTRIGKIDIYEDESYVDVQSDRVQKIIQAFHQATFNGFPLVVGPSHRKEKKKEVGRRFAPSNKKRKKRR